MTIRPVNTITINLDSHDAMRRQVDNLLAVYIAEDEIDALISKGHYLLVDITETTLLVLNRP